MMYNMSMLRHRFSNERWERGGGGGGAQNHLPLLFCKSVYFADNPLLLKFIMKFPISLCVSHCLTSQIDLVISPGILSPWNLEE